MLAIYLGLPLSGKALWGTFVMFPSCDQELSPFFPRINVALSLPSVKLPGVTWRAEYIPFTLAVSGETWVLKKMALAACYLRK